MIAARAYEGVSEKREHVTGVSEPVLDDRTAQLRELIPEASGEAGLDWDKLKTALGASFDERPDRYRFEWAGKRDAIALLQKPSSSTLVPVQDESVNFDTTQHVFIDGENLEVLKLLYKAYAGRVKMIYIDPPYNTGSDFIYRDDYSRPLEAYLEMTGQKEARQTDARDESERATRTGRIHSDWLSMMYPRLFLARQLLREDGLIFVSIDDNEVHHLRMVMNEVFGEENFVATFVRRRRMATGMRGEPVSPDHEYVIAYARSAATVQLYGLERKEADYPYADARGHYRSTDLTVGMTREMRPNQWYAVVHPQTGTDYWPPDGRVWRFQRSVMDRHIADGNIIWPEDESERRLKRPRFKTRYEPDTGRSGSVPLSTWIDSKGGDNDDSEEGKQFISGGLNQEGTKELRDLLGGQLLEYPKPVSLMSALVRLGSTDRDLVVDFFAGSCTTAQAVLELNREDGGLRRFVMVQLPEPIDPESAAGRSGYRTVADVGKQRVRRVIESLQEEQDQDLGLQREDLGFAVFRLDESRLRTWAPPDDADAERYVQSLELFRDPVKADAVAREVIYEIALKEAGYGLNCRIEPVNAVTINVVYRVTDPDRGLHFHICLDEKLDPETPKALGLHGGGDLFVCRDVALDDTLAANLALQCRLKTV